MDLIVVKQDGTTYKLSEHDMKVIKFSKSFPEMNSPDDNFEDRDGFEDNGTFYVSRKLDAVIVFTARDRLDNPLVQNQIFRIFDSRESFYLIDDREPGKRWFAKCSSEFTPDQKNATFGTFDIAFKAQPYAESVGTTLDRFMFDSELWGIGQGLDEDVTEPDQSNVAKWSDIGTKKWSEL